MKLGAFTTGQEEGTDWNRGLESSDPVSPASTRPPQSYPEGGSPVSSPEIRPKHLSLGAFTLHPEVGRLRLPGWERGPAGKGPRGPPGFPVCRLAASLLSAKKQKGVQESVTQAAHHAGHPVASCTIRTMKCNTNTVFYGPCGKTGALPDTGHKNEYFKVGEIQK